MTCPKCGRRQWDYNDHILTCKNGHQIPKGTKPPRRLPLWSLPATVGATLALDFLVRSIT